MVATKYGKRKRSVSSVTAKSKRRNYKKPISKSTSNTSVGTSRSVRKRLEKRGKGVTFKQHRSVKVSGKFRAMVKKATEPNRNHGYKQEIAYRFLDHPAPNEQRHFYSLNYNAGMFSPIRIMDAASVLFNGKADVENFSIDNGVDFATTNTKIDVKKQWVNHTLVNNSLREVTVKIRQFAQKGKTPPENAPYEMWGQGLHNDYQLVGGTKGTNLNNVTRQFKGLCPTANKLFREHFKTTEETVVLEAGQTYKWTIHGPSMMYDYSKYHDGQTNDIHERWGMTRWCLISYYPDMVVSANAESNNQTVGMYVDSDDPEVKNHGLMLETICNYVIVCPEVAGFTSSAAGPGLPIKLDKRKDAYHYANYVVAKTSSEDTHRTDEQNPAGVKNE